MATIDYPYLCRAISRLSSVPVRVYERGQKTSFHSVMPLPVDPILPHERQVLASKDHVGYFITGDFDFYGVIHVNEHAVVMGPCRQIPRTPAELRRLAFDLDVPRGEVEQFVASLGAIIPLPLDFLLEILCMVNYMICGERLGHGDLRVTDLEQAALRRQATEEQTRGTFDEPAPGGSVDAYHAYQIEQEMLALVRGGDIERLEEWTSHAPAVKPGQIAPDALRQEKNIFTVTTTLVSRAAIEGGMDVEDAMRLSDSYIKKCERLSSLDSIVNLQLGMVRNFTRQVAYINDLDTRSELAKKIASYVQHHLSDPIRTEDVAQALHLSRSYLSTRFKKEQGIDLTDFIQQVKINEAKHLLRYTDRSLLTISNYLGFSSQSHFTRVFKAQTGLTPGEYREDRYNNGKPFSGTYS